MSKLMLYAGLGGLCHAAYSATQHRNYLRLTEKEYTRLPLDILVQTLFCLLITGIALIRIVAKFKSIRMSSGWESKTWEHIGNRTSFYSFNHRGKYLFGTGNDELDALAAAESSSEDDSASASEDDDEFEREKALINQKIREQEARARKEKTKEDLEDEEDEDDDDEVVVTSGRRDEDDS